MGLRVRFWRLSTFLITFMLASCADAESRPGFLLSLTRSPSEAGQLRRPLILKSLETVFYRANPLPRFATESEVEEARIRVLAAPQREREVLTSKTVFGDHADLWALAIRDSDQDGIPDFFIDEINGRFYEGDTDVD